MAKTAERAKGFWKTIKAVSVREISREAQRTFALAIVGAPDKRDEVFRHLFPGADYGDVIPDRSLLRTFDSTAAEEGFPQEAGSFDIIIDAGGGRADTRPGLPIYSLDDIEGWDALAGRLLEQRPDLALSMGRRFPGLRDAVARRIIRDTAMANAQFAMLSALPGVIPIIGPLLPATAIGDILMLTKNQAMMMYRLAALHELPLDVSSRSRDLAPLLANAFGWRAIAREVVGAVPGGIGMVARGTIAYAGTVAIGKGLEKLYKTGNQPTRAQLSAFYREAIAAGRQASQTIAQRIRGRRRKQVTK